MSKMILVTENTVVEVGKFYLVTCAIMKYDSGKVIHVPVIGEIHKDNQFSIKYKHYHIDGRFTKGLDVEYDTNKEGATNGIVLCEHVPNKFISFMGTVAKKLKCKRLTTGIRPPAMAKVYWEWYQSYVGRSCKGKKCPHLGTIMHERDGRLVCPLHNLQGCSDTEKIVDAIYLN